MQIRPHDDHEDPRTRPQTPPPRLHEVRRLLERMIHTSLKLRIRSAELEHATGLAGRELDLLVMLTTLGPTSVKHLVADLSLPRSTMTAIVDRLAARGLVVRRPNPEDRRSILLEATPAATEALRAYRQGVAHFLEASAKALDGAELKSFLDAVERLTEEL